MRATGSCRASGALGLAGEPLGQGVRPFGAVACSQADDDVTGSGEVLECRGDLALAADRHHGGVARLTNRLGQGHVVHAVDRHLACRVERRDDDAVGVLEAGGELAEEVAHARVAVRLDDGDDAAARARPGRLQHGCDLYRVMAVVVVDSYTVPRSGEMEATLYSVEAIHRRPY